MNRARMLYLKEQGKLKDPQIAEMLTRKEPLPGTSDPNEVKLLKERFAGAFKIMQDEFTDLEHRVSRLEDVVKPVGPVVEYKDGNKLVQNPVVADSGHVTDTHKAPDKSHTDKSKK